MDNKEWEVSSAQIKKAHGYSTPADQRRLNQTAHEAEELARDILRLSRNTLLINLRFLESAFVRFIPGNETATSEMATDGRFLYYNSAYICRLFQQGREIPARNYLHLVLHCLFRHLFVGKKVNADFWDLACDIAVENVITNLGLKCLYCEREEKQKWLLKKLRGELPHISAERVYRWLLDQGTPVIECARLREHFYADDHKIWHNQPEFKGGSGTGDTRDNAEENQNGEPEASDLDEQGENAPLNDEDEGEETSQRGGEQVQDRQDEQSGSGGAGSGGGQKKQDPGYTPKETEEMWKDISKRIEVDLDTFSNSWGQSNGDMMQELAEINKEKYDYAAFLRRFAILGENIEINDEEFDYIFYTYGLSLYKNMPLVEPLEYKEVRRVREFVIALDTSESVAGELVQKFVAKTWNILKQTENFFTRVNVHIIQCGARVEEDAKITSQDEFDSYIKGMVLRGFGGTDFRPVFAYVGDLIRHHEFMNFKGLIYFTDGCGTYPAMPPDYDAAFVFLDGGREIPEVPAWAIKVLLTQEQIELF